MISMKTAFVLTGLCFALAAPVLMAQAPGCYMMQGGPAAGPGHHGGWSPWMMGGLNLSEAQQTKLQSVAANHRASLDAKLASAIAARDALQEAMADPATPDAQVKAMSAKAAEADAAVALERRAWAKESEAVLTSDQKALWARRSPGYRQGFGPGHCGSRAASGGWGGPGSAPFGGGCWGANN